MKKGSARKKNPREISQGLSGGFRDNASKCWTVFSGPQPHRACQAASYFGSHAA
jgi:hypothetical protein